MAQWQRIHLPMQETQIQSLDQEDSLEKEMATHPSILVWEISWTEDPGRLQSMGWQKVRHDLATRQQQQQQTVYSMKEHCKIHNMEYSNTSYQEGKEARKHDPWPGEKLFNRNRLRTRFFDSLDSLFLSILFFLL